MSFVPAKLKVSLSLYADVEAFWHITILVSTLVSAVAPTCVMQKPSERRQQEAGTARARNATSAQPVTIDLAVVPHPNERDATIGEQQEAGTARKKKECSLAGTL